MIKNKLIDKFLPDLISLYRNNEHDLSIFFSSYSSEYTHICASILMQFSSLDILPNQLNKNPTKDFLSNEFDQIEFQWSQLKLLNSNKEHEEKDIQLDFYSKTNTCELNLNIFKQIIEIYGKNVRFIQQLKDKHLGERSKLILHYAFLGIHILNILQLYFINSTHNDEQIIRFIESIQILFNELTDETI
ncbi:unnamed protein product, partial [Adineta steineri]